MTQFDDEISSVSSGFWSRPRERFVEEGGPPPSANQEEAVQQPLPKELLLPAITLEVANTASKHVIANGRGLPPTAGFIVRLLPRWVRVLPRSLKIVFIICIMMIVTAIVLVVTSSVTSSSSVASNQNESPQSARKNPDDFLAEFNENNNDDSSLSSPTTVPVEFPPMNEGVGLILEATVTPTLSPTFQASIRTTTAEYSDEEKIFNDKPPETSREPFQAPRLEMPSSTPTSEEPSRAPKTRGPSRAPIASPFLVTTLPSTSQPSVARPKEAKDKKDKSSLASPTQSPTFAPSRSLARTVGQTPRPTPSSATIQQESEEALEYSVPSNDNESSTSKSQKMKKSKTEQSKKSMKMVTNKSPSKMMG